MANWGGDSALVFLLLRASWPRAGGRFIANENHICLWRQSIRRPWHQSAPGLANAAGREIAPDRSKFSRDQCQRQRERSEEHTSELQSHSDLVCRLLLEKKKTTCN